MDINKIATQYLQTICGDTQEMRCAVDETIIESMAKNNHKIWCEGKKKDGYVYGPVVDDELKTSDRLVDWDNLCDEAKEASIQNARDTLNILASIGYTPISIDVIVRNITKELHDSWARNKANKGYVYGEKRNDDPTKGQLTHRDMLPFDTLLELYPEDAEYDFTTARACVDQLIKAGFVLKGNDNG